MKSIRNNIPNFITCLRIAGAIGLLFLEGFSAPFYIVYTICGISDIVDGHLARKWKICSEQGALLDRVADLLFYSVMFSYVVPYLWGILPMWIWYWVAIILIVRLAAYLTAAVKYRRFASMHTYCNKLTGTAVFVMPYLIKLASPFVAALIACILGFSSSVEELLIHISAKEYKAERKSLFCHMSKNKATQQFCE